MNRDDEIAAIEKALDALLKVAIEARQRPAEDGDNIAPIQMFHIGQVLDRSGLAERSAWTEAQRRAHPLLENPVGEAVRQAVRTLGKRLHELGGEDLMGDVCDRVADRDPTRWGWRTDIMDKRWDGIGSWVC